MHISFVDVVSGTAKREGGRERERAKVHNLLGENFADSQSEWSGSVFQPL